MIIFEVGSFDHQLVVLTCVRLITYFGRISGPILSMRLFPPIFAFATIDRIAGLSGDNLITRYCLEIGLYVKLKVNEAGVDVGPLSVRLK